MRSLVTGARGFIGSFLVEKLLEKGDEVRCLLRESKKGRGWIDGLNTEIVAGDINVPGSLTGAVKEVDTIFHLAGLTKAVNKNEFDKVNFGGTKNLLEAVKRFNPNLKRFVLVSSLAATGPSRDERPLTETVTPVPVSNYGKSKLMAEKITLEYADAFPVSIVRPPAVFGPRDKDIFEIFKNTQRGVRPVLSGGPRYVSAIYIMDLVDGLLLTAEKDAAIGQAYFLCNNEVYSLDDLENAIAQTLGKNPIKMTIPLFLAFLVAGGFELMGKLTQKPAIINLDKYKELKETHWICDNSKAKKELGFNQNYKLEDALKTTAEWYRAKGWL